MKLNIYIMQKINRVKAGLLHFCLSLSIFTIIFFVLFTLWYPEPYFSVSGGWQGLKIVGSIDLVLGPLLTLVIFNPLKPNKELKTDLSVIFVIQMAALVWGIFTVYQQRIVATVFWENNFIAISAIDLTSQNYPLSELQKFSNLNPALIYADKPRDADGLNRMMENLKKHDISPIHQTEFYRPFLDNFDKITPMQISIEAVIKDNQLLKPQLDKLLANCNCQKTDMKFFTLKAKYFDMILAFNAKGEQIGYLKP